MVQQDGTCLDDPSELKSGALNGPLALRARITSYPCHPCGVTAEISGGKFIQGMGQGAWTAAYGFIFNDCGVIIA